MQKKGNEYRLSSTGNWVLSDKAKKILDKLEKKKAYRREARKGQKNK